MSANDDAVRATNDDAASCKRSAVQLGYWSDPYVQFLSRASDRKPPEISRGYYARVRSIQGLIRQFFEMAKLLLPNTVLALGTDSMPTLYAGYWFMELGQLTGGDCQVVNLGAGSDTWFWNLVDEGRAPRKAWIEVDFAECTARKIQCIRSRKQLLEKIKSDDEDVSFTRTDLHSGIYHLVACDLRDTAALSTALNSCGIDYQLPTAFIAECVLVYMTAGSSSALVKWIADQFSTAFFVNYEQVNMGDRFGKVMIDNLLSRGCALAGVDHCMSVDTQKARFTSNGWQAAEAVDMMTVYNSLPGADLQRIERIEMLDDRDMLSQLCSHYCLCWARLDKRPVIDDQSATVGGRRLDLGVITLNRIT